MTLAVTLMNFITCRDHKVMLRVNQWRAPSWVRLWATWATRAGDGWLWYAVGVLVLLFGGRQRFLAVGSAALSAGCGVVIFWNVKGPRAGVVLCVSNLTVGQTSYRRTSSPSPRATRSRRLQWRCRLAASTRTRRGACYSAP